MQALHAFGGCNQGFMILKSRQHIRQGCTQCDIASQEMRSRTLPKPWYLRSNAIQNHNVNCTVLSQTLRSTVTYCRAVMVITH